DLTLFDAAGYPAVDDLSLEVRRGEILAVAGVQGNGQTELTEAILGIGQPAAGSIRLDNTELADLSVKQRLRAGLGFVPEDRSTDGIIEKFSVAENLVLHLYDTPPFASGMSMHSRVIRDNALHRATEF